MCSLFSFPVGAILAPSFREATALGCLPFVLLVVGLVFLFSGDMRTGWFLEHALSILYRISCSRILVGRIFSFCTSYFCCCLFRMSICSIRNVPRHLLLVRWACYDIRTHLCGSAGKQRLFSLVLRLICILLCRCDIHNSAGHTSSFVLGPLGLPPSLSSICSTRVGSFHACRFRISVAYIFCC